MSYILDALRRAEAERERGHVPGLHDQALGAVAAPSNDASARGGQWALPAILALIAAVAVLAWRPWAVELPVAQPVEPVSTAPVAPASAALPAALPAPVAPLRVPEVTVRREASGLAKKRIPSVPVAAASTPASAAEAKVHSVAELPPEVRQQLPPIAIGGSIYSASPASRFVIVNGQLFHEGDTLAPGVVLEQIRLKSAVLAFRGYRFGITY